MIDVTVFDDPWYARYINQVLDRSGDEASDDARLIASAIMTAGAFIAASMDETRKQNGLNS